MSKNSNKSDKSKSKHISGDINKKRKLNCKKISKMDVSDEEDSNPYTIYGKSTAGFFKTVEKINQDSILLLKLQYNDKTFSTTTSVLDYITFKYDNFTDYVCVICDGHGVYGNLISNFIVKYFTVYINTIITNIYTNRINKNHAFSDIEKKHIKDKLALFVNSIQDSLLKNFESNTLTVSGSTLLAALIINNVLFVINVGDCRCILGQEVTNKDSKDNAIEVTQLTTDHKPETELLRITNAGGQVVKGPMNIHRIIPSVDLSVKFQKPLYGLTISRAFGDTLLQASGLIFEPDIFIRDFSSKDKFVLLCSDGIFTHLSNEEVRDIISPYLDDPKLAVAVLLTETKKRWKEITSDTYVDDHSAILITF